MNAPTKRIALTLGLLSAVGPFAIDMYLPAMPRMAEALGTTVAGTQTTLTAFFLAFGVAQLFFGPWSDQVGRRAPLYAGMGMFMAGSLGCMLAPTIGWLVTARALQGFGAAVVMVIPRAIVRDLHTGPEATRLMASIMLVISVSPMLAPLVGSIVILTADWRAIFATLTLAAVASLTLVRLALPETLPPARRERVNLRFLFNGAKKLLADRIFIGLTLVGGFANASFFVFIASASFVYESAFGLGPVGFSVAFAMNAVGFFGATQMAAPLGLRFGMARVVRMACTGFALCTILLFGAALLGLAGLWMTVGLLLLSNACLGLVIPNVMVMALDPHGRIAGLASSLGGTLQTMVGGVMITAAGPFFDGTVVPMAGAIAVCGILTMLTAHAVLARRTDTISAGLD